MSSHVTHRISDRDPKPRCALQDKILAFFDAEDDDEYLLMGDVTLKFDVPLSKARRVLRALALVGVLEMTQVKEGRALQHRFQRKREST